ncbi:hypothetical protein [Phytoactinopolyspora endophytica]|uniref:hypothetical protein n=1 Tax=Phytoactinopolyspora endophytica TaxID=1642495 RepID=UPI00101DE519|nr:hypothetical protein [Phytoactinopolyspora endophytica]
MTLLTAMAVAACGGDDDGDGPQTFDDDAYPFTFEYPADFEVTDDVNFSVEAGGSLEDSRAVALDEENMLILSRTTLNLAIDDSNIDLAKGEMDQLYQQIDPESEPGQESEYGGYTSLEYEVSVDTPPDGTSRIVSLFDGDQQYTINCQSTPDSQEEIDDACQQALDTLSQA